MAYKRKEKPEYFKLWSNIWPILSQLTFEQRGMLLTAMYSKFNDVSLPELDHDCALVFPLLSIQMDKDLNFYKSQCEKNAENRALSKTADDDRRPVSSSDDKNDQGIRNKVKGNKVIGSKEIGNKEKESNSASEPRRARFVPPAEQEAAAYFAEQGGAAAQAAQFCNYYAARGWTTGKANSPMRDWHAAARNWILREKDFRASAAPAQEPLQGRSSWGGYARPTEADEAIKAFEAAHERGGAICQQQLSQQQAPAQ